MTRSPSSTRPGTTSTSAQAAAVIGRTPEQIRGEYVWDIFPEVVGTPQHAAALHAMEQRERVRIVWYFDAVDTWYEQHALPIGEGLVVLVNDGSSSCRPSRAAGASSRRG